jgi:hypothetical protein
MNFKWYLVRWRRPKTYFLPDNLEIAYYNAQAKKPFSFIRVTFMITKLSEQQGGAFKDSAAGDKNGLAFKFGKQTMTPAPYYLVWPKKGPDEWRYPRPFQLVSISLPQNAAL